MINNNNNAPSPPSTPNLSLSPPTSPLISPATSPRISPNSTHRKQQHNFLHHQISMSEPNTPKIGRNTPLGSASAVELPIHTPLDSDVPSSTLSSTSN